MSSQINNESQNKSLVSTQEAWLHPELEPLDFKKFRARIFQESGWSIDSRKIYALLRDRTKRKTSGDSKVVANGLLYCEFAAFLEGEESLHSPKLALIDRCEFQAALCHHPLAIMSTISYARQALLGTGQADDLSQETFDRLEKAWLFKGALEDPWLAGYLKHNDCAGGAFHIRLRLAEIHWGTPRGDRYLRLARETCTDSTGYWAEVLEQKLKELSARHSALKHVVCVHPFSERESASERDGLQLQQYSILQKPLPFACIERPLESTKVLLDTQFPWMSNVTQHFMEQLQTHVLMGQRRIALRPTLLVGEPGIGKNRYLNALAKTLGLPSQIIVVGGSGDNRALSGTARGWSNGRPSQVLTLIANCKTANPLIILDEIEKEGSNYNNGRITDTLHQLLEKGNAKRWHDEFLLTECDLSWVNWIACANSLAGLSDSLLSRLEVVRVARPAHDDMYAVVHGAIKDFADRHHQDPVIMPTLSPACWNLLEDCFKRGYGPRTVAKVTERLMAAVMASEARVLVH